MYETVFRNIDDILRKDAGCSSELDYIEQTSWLLFLKYLDDYEIERENAARIDGKPYTRIIKEEFSWKRWAAPRSAEGGRDSDKILTGDDLRAWVNDRLFPYLARFKQGAESPNTIRYKIGEIFSELKNKLQSGHTLREVIDRIDKLHFLSSDDKHELSALYEDKINNMGNAGRSGGEYYTPRPLIKAIVQVVDPKVGQTVYDGAAGSAGFLCEAYVRMREDRQISTADFESLQTDTFYGKEKKSLAYVIGTMNMILHGIEAPNIQHTNTLSENIADFEEGDRVDVVLANPPFGGKERAEIEHNFPIKTSEPACLFLQHFIKKLKKGGRAGVVIKNTFLNNTDKASVALRRQLLEECSLFAILDLPVGAFAGTKAKAVVLFFEKGKATRKIWYYQLDVGRSLDKTSALNDADMADFVELARKKEASTSSWTVAIADIDKETWDLAVKNPRRFEETEERTPAQIVNQIKMLERQASVAIDKIRKLL